MYKRILLFVVLVRPATSDGYLTITVLHNSDIYSHFPESYRHGHQCRLERMELCAGGVARQTYIVRKLRKENPNALFLNAGNTFGEYEWYTVNRYKPAADFLDITRPDAMTLGRYEFTDGVEGLLPLLQRLHGKVPIVVSNMDFSESPELAHLRVRKSYVLNIGGTQVGIVGAIDARTKATSRDGETIEIENDIMCIQREAGRLRDAGIRIIIAITSVGYERDKMIAAIVTDVTIVVGRASVSAHHSDLALTAEGDIFPALPYPTIITRTDNTKALVVHSHGLKYMGYINITYDDTGRVVDAYGQTILLDQSIPKDHEMLQALGKYQDNITAAGEKVVGTTRVPLTADSSCLWKECLVGNLLADAYFDFHANRPTPSSLMWSNVHGAIVNTGTLRRHVTLNSTISHYDVLRLLPFWDKLVVVTISGADIRKIFETSVKDYNPAGGGGSFLQVAGFVVSYDVTRPVGQRVLSIQALCNNCLVPQYVPLNSRHHYNVVTNTFMYDGGDGFDFENAIAVEQSDIGGVEAFEAYITKMSPVVPIVVGRSVVITRNPLAKAMTPQTANAQEPLSRLFLVVIIWLLNIMHACLCR
ncbi:protein 5NUC-like isoform X1 [Ornithodoros turicata]|uniref:protein 5NUC-like isoform X1 n=1 Tax=Ornithodoros turicata TaxID=34597 RepID=UPI003139DA98